MPTLPSELVDNIIDFLRDETEALRQCCLVSRTWIDPTRKHLFNNVLFKKPKYLKAWRSTFRNPANSPAKYTRTLAFPHVEMVTDEDASWIRMFTKVTHLELGSVARYIGGPRKNGPFTRFHGCSSAVKSLCVGWNELPLREVFELIRSFPLLEDLTVSGRGCLHTDEGISRSPRLRMLTGSLVFEAGEGDFVRRLLELSNGLCFRNIVWKENYAAGSERLGELVARCSDTLECVEIDCRTSVKQCSLDSVSDSASYWFLFVVGPVDLSAAKRLKRVEIEFNSDSYSAAWVTATLDTITPEHRDFKLVSIYFTDLLQDTSLVGLTKEATYSQWMDLDRNLVRLWESHAIRTKVAFNVYEGQTRVTYDDMKYLFREMTTKGRIELVLYVINTATHRTITSILKSPDTGQSIGL